MPYATAKASILFLHKKQDINETQPPIFMAHAEHVGRKSNGDPLYAEHRDDNGQPEMQDELPFILKKLDQLSCKWRTGTYAFSSKDIYMFSRSI